MTAEYPPGYAFRGKTEVSLAVRPKMSRSRSPICRDAKWARSIAPTAYRVRSGRGLGLSNAIPQALEMAIRKNVAKRYGSRLWLVIYLNLNDYGIRQRQTELIIAQVKQKHASAFNALFVLWKDKLY
jgi:hypothetical protein